MDNAKSQAQAQYEEILALLTAKNVDFDRLEELSEMDVLDESEQEEFDDLKEAAGEFTSNDEALERIQEAPLSIEFRSDWQSYGEELTPSEFNILLCTGGPAVRIVGEIGEHGEARRAWLEYQDWGTPWTQHFIDSDVLIEFANHHLEG